MANTQTISIDTSKDASLEAVAKILIAHTGQPVYAYQRNAFEDEATWFVGVDSQASFTVDPRGETATVETGGAKSSTKITGNVKNDISAFTSRYSQDGGMVFGNLAFNYYAYINGLKFTSSNWPLVSLMVPRLQIRVEKGTISLRNATEKDLQAVKKALSGSLPNFTTDNEADETQSAQQYREIVQRAVGEINGGMYQKVIPSRPVDLPFKVDMVGTLVSGRRANNPRTAYMFEHNGYSATGFSPELVFAAEGDLITTEPLAGTRENVGTDDEKSWLKHDLLNDPKEVSEHVYSVQEAVREMKRFCADGTVTVPRLMDVRPRGKVQHLASSVTGTLGQSKDIWDALNTLFPAITATGIPKMTAIEAIYRLETKPRELYSGAILLFDGSNFAEATLTLRSCFQDPQRTWLQAGAGVVALSKPERELTETKEKLRSICTFVKTGRE